MRRQRDPVAHLERATSGEGSRLLVHHPFISFALEAPAK